MRCAFMHGNAQKNTSRQCSSFGASISRRRTTSRNYPPSCLRRFGRTSLRRNSDGSIWSWGSNGSGELGDSAVSVSSIPVAIIAPMNMVAAAAGSFHALALAADGSVWAWGSDSNGELGSGTRRSNPIPQRVPGLPIVTRIAAGLQYSLALDTSGKVWSWGMENAGQLGNGSTSGAQLVPRMLTTAT